MMDNNDNFKKLENHALKKGYKVNATSYINTSYNNQTKKVITIYCQINNRENAILAHEIGHIYEYKFSKYSTIFNEFMAWVFGYFVCKKNKIKIDNYWKVAKECLLTYIKRT